MWIHEGGGRIEEQAYLGTESIAFFEVIEERLGRTITASDMTQALEVLCGEASEALVDEIVGRLKGSDK